MDELIMDCELCYVFDDVYVRRVHVRFPDRSNPGAAMNLCQNCIDRYVAAGAAIDPPLPALF